MFSGLSRNLKKILPKQLFYRSLIIVAAPIIIMQITISIVFFDSLWINTNKGMTKALVDEISTFVEFYNNEDYDNRFDNASIDYGVVGNNKSNPSWTIPPIFPISWPYLFITALIP